MRNFLRKHHLHETLFIFSFLSIFICSYRRDLLNQQLQQYVKMHSTSSDLMYSNQSIGYIENLSNNLFYLQILCFGIVTIYLFYYILNGLYLMTDDRVEA
jgi:hypothetical protein